MDTRVTQVTARYTSYDTFKIPEDVFLLGKEENEKAGVSDYGAWYVRYSTLYYIDKDGKERTLESDCHGQSDDNGHPDDVETEEKCITPKPEESESESESEGEMDSDEEDSFVHGFNVIMKKSS